MPKCELADPKSESGTLTPSIDDLGKGEEPPSETKQPYHVFSKQEKWELVVIICAAGLFSGLSSNIYFPALDAIAKDLNVTSTLVSLSITSYLVVQGISPVFWGAFADCMGRRPCYIASFTVYLVANLGLSFSPNLTALVVLRGLQSAGSASTVSLGNGVLQDVTTPAERGSFMSIYQATRNFSIAIGPVLGGALVQNLGFRAIFIFLFAFALTTLFIIVTLLPETLRSIAGNGSIRLTGIYQPLAHRFTKEHSRSLSDAQPISQKKVTIAIFTNPLKLLGEKDILLNLVFAGLVYTVWSMVTATTTSIFKSAFHLNETLLGVCFLSNGIGTIIGSAVIGKLMSRDFRRTEQTYKSKNDLPADYELPAKAIPHDFPIEAARLGRLPWITSLLVVSMCTYGFAVGYGSLTSIPGWIAVPLTMQFFIAASSNAIFSMNQTLMSDLCPGMGASSTAINNLVRCGLGAVGVASSEMMLEKLGPTLMFSILASVIVAAVPLVIIGRVYGAGWRAMRSERQAAKQEALNSG